MTRRLIIFGGAGFAGLNIVEALLRRGATVVSYDRADVPAAARAAFAHLPGRLESIVADVRDAPVVRLAIMDGTDGIVFASAITADADRDSNAPSAVLETNLLSLVPILERARAANVRRVVNVSSVAAYGETAARVPVLEETAPCDPQTLYGLSKFATERVVDRLAALWSRDFVSVRLCSVFGPWEYATGMRDTLSPHLQMMLAAAAGHPGILPRPVARDWVFAPDMADAVVTVLDAPKLNHALYNISPGQRWSMLAFGHALATLRPGFVCRVATDCEAATIHPHVMTDRAILSPERLRNDLGWQAKTSMAEAVEAYDAWWRGPGRGFVGV